MKEKCCTHVAVELWETFFFWKVGVPDADNLENVEFSSQIAGYPAVGKVHKNYVHLLQIIQRFCIDLFYYRFHFIDHFVYSRLQICVIVLNIVYKLGQTPKRICLNS